MLSDEQRDEFFERGYTVAAGAVDPEAIGRAADAVWRELAGHGVDRTDPATWRRTRPKGLQRQATDSRYATLFDGSVSACVDELLGEDAWERPHHWGQPLVSLPNDTAWGVPHQAWHVDLPQSLAASEVPGVQLFVCIEDIEATCGATLVAAGTHRFVMAAIVEDGLPARQASARLRERLSRRSAWFARLTTGDHQADRSAFFTRAWHEEHGVPLRVEPLTGRAGDLIMMHPCLFHAPAPNVGPAVRIAVTQRLFSRSSG